MHILPPRAQPEPAAPRARWHRELGWELPPQELFLSFFRMFHALNQGQEIKGSNISVTEQSQKQNMGLFPFFFLLLVSCFKWDLLL